MSVKALVRRGIRRFGYDLVKFHGEPAHDSDVMRTLLSSHIHQLLTSNPDFFFIQIGASDGVHHDPIRSSILAHHLRGLLVEPLPDVFSRLRQNYLTEPQLLFEQVAIGDEPGRLRFYRVKPGTGLDAWEGVASFDKRHLQRHRIPEDCIQAIDVDVVTIPALIEKHGIREVTLLQVDTEGYDYQVVKSALETGLRPKIINYEHVHLSREHRMKSHEMLRQMGYSVMQAGMDTLCLFGAGIGPSQQTAWT